LPWVRPVFGSARILNLRVLACRQGFDTRAIVAPGKAIEVAVRKNRSVSVPSVIPAPSPVG